MAQPHRPHDLEYWHNKGEQDYAEHNGYNEPHDMVEMTFDYLPNHQDEMRAENKAYSEGYANARKQADK